MKLSDIKWVNELLQKFKDKPKPEYRGKIAGRINRERNQQKRFSRKMRGVQ